MSTPLSKHESELLQKATDYVKETIKEKQKLPSRWDLRCHLECKEESAGRLLHHIIDSGLVELPPAESVPVIPPPAERESDAIDKEKRVITLPKTRIHTLEALIAFFEIDETVWKCERFIANKWEVAAIPRAISSQERNKKGNRVWERESTTPIVEPLYQVKAYFKRNYTQTEADVLADENATLLRQVAKLRLDVGVQKRYSKRLAVGHAGYDDLLTDVKQFVSTLEGTLGGFSLPTEHVAAANPASVPPVREGHSEDAVLLLSDTHFGDVIRREDTSGFPEFDLVIAGNRFGYVIRKAKQCLSLHRAMYPIKRLYVWLGGDIGNGVLHDSPNSNALFPPAQVHFSYNMLKFALDDLLTLTEPDATGNRVIEEIVLLCTVGNHMRMDEKMPHKYQAQRTLDWLIYQSIIERYSTHPKVKVRAEMSPYIFETIRNHRYLFAHGMQVGYRNSPDAQCKSMNSFIDKVRALFDSPEWRRSNGLQGETFARICIGDIHVPVQFPRLISNGSLNGQNELGVNWTMEPIPAGQQLFGVADNHIQTWNYFLSCSHVQRRAEDFNSYGVFAAEYAKRIGRC